MMNKIIAIPMGDPAGIGPEITVKALSKKEIYEACSPLVIGNTKVIKEIMNVCNIDLKINEVKSPNEGKYQFGTIDILSIDNIDVSSLKMGKIQAQAGKAAFEYIKVSVGLAMNKEVLAIATTPINKESLQAANIPFIGHTEMLEELTNSKEPLTMFEVENLRIFFLTRHLSLKDAINQIKKDRVYHFIKRCDEALQRLGIEERTIAVAGLNPHAGENGLFGREEIDELAPAIELAQKDGIKVVGPVPADSVFYHALQGRYTAVLSLYHDQGHIAAKMTDFEKTISITNGLPFLRTSVDHGTAFDIAGKGIASSVSMEECIKLAAKYGENFRSSS